MRLLARDVRAADLVVIGSHCVGLDYLLGLLQDQGFHTKFLSVGSTAGLSAATRNECDLAGIHLLDVTIGPVQPSLHHVRADAGARLPPAARRGLSGRRSAVCGPGGRRGHGPRSKPTRPA